VTRVTSSLGLYVHIPFCERKCAYCHFAIDPRRPDEERHERYLRALLAEMRAAPPGTADTLYFGGGTPSLLAPGRIRRIVDLARERFSLPPGSEITLEANPRDLGVEALRELRAIGVDRLSLGVQSLDDGVLAEMGRRHTAAEALAAIDDARAAGFENLSVDLILGWPGESEERWMRGLTEVVRARPDHVSLYLLEVAERTALGHRVQGGRVTLPEDALEEALYHATVERLEEAGLPRYEISNFARPGRESRHNGKYWDDEPFLGFGLSAHSYRERLRWWNLESFEAYCRGMESAPPSPVAGSRPLDAEARLSEALFTGLRRRDGIDLDRFRLEHGVDVLERFGASLQASFDAGLVATIGGRLRLTRRGLLLSNEVFRAFV
jgi:oxygen-independent coproporphyrinogen III oxidase